MTQPNNKSEPKAPAVKEGELSPPKNDNNGVQVVAIEEKAETNEEDGGKIDDPPMSLNNRPPSPQQDDKSCNQGFFNEPSVTAQTDSGIQRREEAVTGGEETVGDGSQVRTLVVNQNGEESDGERNLEEAERRLSEAGSRVGVRRGSREIKKKNKKDEGYEERKGNNERTEDEEIEAVGGNAKMEAKMEQIIQMVQEGFFGMGEELHRGLTQVHMEFGMLGDDVGELKRRVEVLEGRMEGEKEELRSEFKGVVEEMVNKALGAPRKEWREEKEKIMLKVEEKVSGASAQIDKRAGVATVPQAQTMKTRRMEDLEINSMMENEERRGGKLEVKWEDRQKASRDYLKIVPCFGGKQHGVQATTLIEAGRLIAIMELHEWGEDSMMEYSIMGDDGVTMMDGQKGAGALKFVNQSCHPNGELYGWVDDKTGKEMVGFVTRREIKPDEYLSFDYGWIRQEGKPRTRCWCEYEDVCRGWLEHDEDHEDEPAPPPPRSSPVAQPGAPVQDAVTADAQAWTEMQKLKQVRYNGQLITEKKRRRSSTTSSNSSKQGECARW